MRSPQIKPERSEDTADKYLLLLNKRVKVFLVTKIAQTGILLEVGREFITLSGEREGDGPNYISRDKITNMREAREGER